jgi:long-subunit fatty acid transport protein
MLRVIFVYIFCLVYTSSAWSAFDNYGSSARILSLGDASVALTDEPSVMRANPGALGFIPQKGIQASLSRLYDLDELAERDVLLAWPFSSFSLGAGFYVFGKNDYYQESVMNFAFAYRINNRLSLGTNLKYMQASFSEDYGDLSAFSLDVGSAYQINEKIQVGLTAINLNRPHLVKKSDDIPTNFALGAVLLLFPEVSLHLDLTYEDRYKEQLHFGQEIKLVKNLPLRFGIQTSPARYALGLGFVSDKLAFDYAYLNHSILGNTHKVTFTYRWGRRGAD